MPESGSYFPLLGDSLIPVKDVSSIRALLVP
jgi:hypothetical protein